MSTIYTFHQECAALGAVPAADDELLIYDTSTGITKNVTAALLGEAARTVVAGTTAASLNGYGVTIAPSSAAALTIADPTQAGQEATILFPSSTATRSVTRTAATILGTTGAPSGGTVLTVTGTTGSPSASVTLIAATTAIWYVKAQVGPVTCT
jgi:hypothetical protein